MRLQLLGDSLDAFKWDLVHWLCTRSAPAYSHLLFVPMLTQDVPNSKEGRTPHERFSCRAEIRTFLERLRTERSLAAVRGLGSIDSGRQFQVVVWPPEDRYVGSGADRSRYWANWSLNGLSNVLTFIDPDTGFETRTQDGEKWVRHSEVERLLHALPDSSCVIVYQHHRHRKWDIVFDELRRDLHYAPFAAAMFHGQVAFVVLARSDEAAARIDAAARTYVANNGSVHYQVLDPRLGEALPSRSPPRNRRREPRACECGCGGSTQRRFMPGHDAILRAWRIRVERGVIRLDEIPHDGIRASVARVLGNVGT